MKKFSLVLALSLALMLTIGVSVAMAAPGDYPPASTSTKYTATLNGTEGTRNTTEWGLSNGLVNANLTGQGADTNDGSTLNQIIKNVKNQRTHGEYANDTNSCASCHQTHTASGRQLLFKNGIYNTCAACHDGTLGFYNVFEGSNAGTFGGNPDKAVGNASVHLATGVMKNSAAPGGNRTSTTSGSWGADFTCASCHSPHGSYSDRLLHYNPNNVGNTLPAEGGAKLVNQTVSFDSASGKYTSTKPGPWLYGYARVTGQPNAFWTQIRVRVNGTWTNKVPTDPTKSYNDVLKVNYGGGYFTDPNNVLNGVALADIQMDIAPATVVKINQAPIAHAGAEALGLPVTKVTSYQSGVSGFCAACHTDYNSNSAATPYGTFSKAFRHKIVQGLKAGMIGEPDAYGNNNASMVCLSCHFAHGADASIMLDARDQVVTSPDVNASSALKRYTNMAVCWKCHTDSKATQLKNNDYFWQMKSAGNAPVI